MAWPLNPQVNSDIVHDEFYSALDFASGQRFYTRLTAAKSQEEITATYTSFGSPPEPRQMSNVAGGGARQAVLLKDWLVNATVNEWESTVYLRRLLVESKPELAGEKARQMADKAMKSMDKQLCQALASALAGYDGVSVINDAHPESGANQDNALTENIAVTTAPTVAEAEAGLATGITGLLGFTDDNGTPVNEGVQNFVALVPETMKHVFIGATSEKMSQQAVDSSGATGRFRGLVEVISSAYCSQTGLPGGTKDQFYLFAAPDQTMTRAIAVCQLKDWSFNNNVGDESSDDWNKGEGYLRSWAAHVMVPWNWQAVVRVRFN